MKPHCLFVAGAFSAAMIVSATRAQTASPAPTERASEEEPVVLSPFKVDASRDKGYRATNSISGTRLNTAIKDLPMPIEVITEEFLRDTGARTLRDSLRYSSGILLQTQNDYSAPAGSFSTSPGKINNPEGMTASATQTNMKIRGFQTESVLRDGFRRQNATDSVNIDRVEIARGPASLLYGVGNFGGVVNYLVKQPLRERATELSATYGSDNFMRATLDTTGPITANGSVAYRLTGAWQDTGSYTDFNDENHYFISPVVSWRPFESTELVFDVEYGHQKNMGIGWQTLRAVASPYVNEASGYNGNFYQIPGRDVREFRWSGPDTYRDGESANFLVKLTQRITDNLHLLVGVNRSTFNYDQLDNLAHFRRIEGDPGDIAWAVAPVTYAGLSSTQSGIPVGPQPSAIGYQWELRQQEDVHDQVRAELNFAGELFRDSSKWLRMKHSLLGGFSYTRETSEYHTRQTPGDVVNYHSPADYSYFRFGQQGNGTPDHPLVEWDNQETTVSNPALYLVYQGRLLDDRLTLIGGTRRDRSWNSVWQYNPQYRSDGTKGGDAERTDLRSDTNKDTTYQWGASLAITPKKDLSIYWMRSEGVQPNYQGKLDLYGRPLQAAIATNKEIGLKFDLFGGRLSGTISKFKIVRERGQVGSSSLVWFAPVVSGNLKFDPAKDIVYRVDELNPVTNDWNGAAVASAAQWDAAVAAGSVYQATNSAGETHWYANASKPTGAALLDAVFANVHAQKQYGWWGWIYGGADPGSLPFDNLVNNATMDDNGAQRAVATGTDQSKGWDTQIIWSLTDNLQVVATWSHIEKRVLNAQAWAKYPYPQDRWAIWYAPISWAATAGRPLSEVYTDPTDTSTFIAFGKGLPMDDTPENQATLWVNYKFTEGTMKGWSFGAGGWWEDERSIYPAYGQNALDNQGNPIFLSTKARTSVNAMVRYEFLLRGRESSVQLNVDNVLNDRDLYGFIYAAPIRWQLSFNHRL
ncbi:TonB-dependent siderophore receptor [Opitutus terrae]|uniref:TonB-dependent receptor plug n=1 Tax=Opitutus terrae (strain DSM 11246 / JCM 15787 / PB90-1) TaxID=452637 RepID=B1ZR84_OPITP|nr:TonB-dependent receptor plug domain-containing protein [Opitutus terrae]ACB74571.1 TonB-dependent receptor plug [Opitutus terrae PB90-1]